MPTLLLNLYVANTKLLFALACVFIVSCSNKPNLQIVTESSNVLKCEKVFGHTLRAVEEENEILLQIGVIDTTDEYPPIKSAIVHIDNREVILNFVKAEPKGVEINEIYKGSGYTLTLKYVEKQNQFGTPFYDGKFIIEDSISKREVEVSGRYCAL